MNLRRIALTALAGALPLTALAAAPAAAAGYDDHKPYVKVKAYDYEGKAKVKYRCYTEKDDKHDENEWGKLRISFKGAHATKWVKCDGHEGHVWAYFDKKKDGYVKAVLTDPDKDKARDSDYHDGKHKDGHK